jgi:Cu(I)/Ag(I) efflux system membrane fusion protein/cobalt-zinc-cadmium efflux system membrane fusion protein
MMRALLTTLLLAIALLGGCPSPETPAPSAQDDQLYTCGMHPNVIAHEPGTCPICGMNLTPMDNAAAAPSGERKIKYWQAPMDPTYIRDEPGKSPMGMDLVPVYEDDMGGDDGFVKIRPGIVQQMGVETAPVERTTVFRHVRTIGEVEVGEDELSVVNLRFSGWVEKIHADKTGDLVKQGQRLFDIYSPELVAAQEEYLLALRTQGPDSSLARSARRKLELWDVTSRDIDHIAQTGASTRTIPIRAPQAGYLLHKNVVEGARIKAGTDLYRIGNLDRIWVTAEIYEADSPWVEVGQPAQMELTNIQGEVIGGEVSYIYPTLNPISRTLSVRLEFDNPGIRLKPGMFATVHIQYQQQDDVVAVPSEAILDSGRRKLVFVAHGRGSYEPREVTTGLVGDRSLTEVVSGLEAGELVVVSGQFLLDSESQLNEALRKIMAGVDGAGAAAGEHDHPDTLYSCPMHPEVLADGEGRCPTCGMDLVERPGTHDELEEVYMTSGAQPGQYTCPMHPEIVEDEAGRCPKCGMFLEQVPEPATDEVDEHAGHGEQP